MEKKSQLGNQIIKLLGCMVVAIAIIFVGQIIGGLVIGMPYGFASVMLPKKFMEAWDTGVLYAAFIGIWIAVIAYLKISKKNQPILDVIGTKLSGNNWINLCIGFLMGFGLNGFCILIAWLNKDIRLTFRGFRPISFVILFLCVFVQSSAEELVCRGYLYQKAIQIFKKPVVAIVANSSLFAILHLLNDGITILSVLNIFLSGILFSLIVYYMDSLWCTFALHTAWNFTQNILFGLPNSGMPAKYSVFQLDLSMAKDSFAYNTGFGIEGTIVADLVLLFACVAVFVWGRKNEKKAYDVWKEEENL